MYRTRTYIAADWDNDNEAVKQLHAWNNSKYWSLSFSDAHDLMQARDSSLNCSIKSSLKSRIDVSKRFVLIVGENTTFVKAGGCQYCNSYNSHNYSCSKGYTINYKSYIQYECEQALKAYNNGEMKIIVLYNSCSIDKMKCPDILRNIGIHRQMGQINNDGKCYYDYQTVKDAFDMSDENY